MDLLVASFNSHPICRLQGALSRGNRQQQRPPALGRPTGAGSRPQPLPHLACGDLWGELDEEEALQLAMRLSMEEAEAHSLAMQMKGGIVRRLPKDKSTEDDTDGR
eukprot:scaffold337464_cov31-Prasinocladus_malaysianus.AAC.2